MSAYLNDTWTGAIITARPLRILVFEDQNPLSLQAGPADVDIVLLSGDADAGTLADALETVASQIRRRHRLAPIDEAHVAEEAPTAGAAERTSDEPQDVLSDRQRQIVSLIAHGYSNREIAARVHLSENTVKSHIQAIFRKLGVRTRVEAAIRADRDGLLCRDHVIPGGVVNESLREGADR